MAFHTAMICYMASLRIFLVGVRALFEALHGNPPKSGDQFSGFYGKLPRLEGIVNEIRKFDTLFFGDGAEASRPTFLGWLGWL